MRVSFGSPDLTCSVCIQPYDLEKHKPMVLCLNMHTICIQCAKRTKSKLCPFCKRKYQIKDLVQNRYIIQQIKSKFPDIKGFSSQNQISKSESQKVLSKNQNYNDFDQGYFGNNNSSNNNNSHNNNVNPYEVIPPRQIQAQNNMVRQINYSQNLSADNAVIRVDRSNRANQPNIVNRSANNQPVRNNQQNGNNQRGNNYNLNPVRPPQNNASQCKNIFIGLLIFLVMALGVYFVSQGEDYYGGAAACAISAVCGCISLLCKTEQQRDVYVYQPNRPVNANR